jgi:glyoxylase-like metal-dependent hydrolase (beta-lactamase superfamily II)
VTERQEQENAVADVTQVAPDVLRMQLPIRLPGLGHVNMYAITDGEGAAVVDPGLPGPASWRAIGDRLKQAGLKTSDVHTVITTHSHPDHFGGAARFAKESGAQVVAHRSFAFGPMVAPEDDQPEVSVDDLAAQGDAESGGEEQSSASKPPLTSHWDGPTPWGGKGFKRNFRDRLRWRSTSWFGRGSFVPIITHPVQQGDVLMLGGREWFVTHTPGHTADHICIHDPDNGTFLAGDHVLPTITPHISGLGSSEDPLSSFLYSLDRVAELTGVKQVLPAHGHPFSDLADRARAIKRHHFERLERIKEISRELGPSNVEQFSHKLFKPRSWGPMAESETYAHLEHLRIGGDAERRDEKGGYIYVTS